MGAGLLTDHYELTMLRAALESGMAQRRCVFEVFARSLPGRRRYGVVAGLGRLLALLPETRYDDGDLAFLTATGVVDATTASWLASHSFAGDIDGYAEGEAYFPGSPVLTVSGTFAECVLLETLVLSVLNHDTAVATAAARMVGAASGRPLLEMGSRRTHEDAAVAAARAAYLAGFAGTSNLAAGRRWGVPTVGTAAHAFTLLYGDERAAFAAQVASLGAGTTLLVDTFDTPTGLANAVAVAGSGLGAIRIDSGDLADEARDARAMLDAAGATGTHIVVTGDLDEFAIAALAQAPVSAYGVGTSVVTGSGAPTAGFVYKLVAREDADGALVPVAKTSPGKASAGGRKTALRRYDGAGVARAELVTTEPLPPALPDARTLQHPWVRGGDVVDAGSLSAARSRCAASLAELPGRARSLTPGDPVVPTVSSADA